MSQYYVETMETGVEEMHEWSQAEGGIEDGIRPCADNYCIGRSGKAVATATPGGNTPGQLPQWIECSRMLRENSTSASDYTKGELAFKYVVGTAEESWSVVDGRRKEAPIYGLPCMLLGVKPWTTAHRLAVFVSQSGMG